MKLCLIDATISLAKFWPTAPISSRVIKKMAWNSAVWKWWSTEEGIYKWFNRVKNKGRTHFPFTGHFVRDVLWILILALIQLENCHTYLGRHVVRWLFENILNPGLRHCRQIFSQWNEETDDTISKMCGSQWWQCGQIKQMCRYLLPITLSSLFFVVFY